MVSEVSAPLGGGTPSQDTVSLKDYVLSLMGERDKANAAALEAQRNAITIALQAQEKALSAALAAANLATDKALVDADKWRENSNEWRASMNDRERKFLQRDEYLVAHKALEDKVDNKNIQVVASFSIGLVAVLIAVFNFATNLAG